MNKIVDLLRKFSIYRTDLLAESSIEYNKRLVALRGKGDKPSLLTFDSEEDGARWRADGIAKRREKGVDWAQHIFSLELQQALDV